MKSQDFTRITKLIVDIISELGHYDLGQIVGLLKANQISTEEISKALYIIRAYTNIINFPKHNHLNKVA